MVKMISYFIMLLILLPSGTFAYDEKNVHPAINENAAYQSTIFTGWLKEFGLDDPKGILEKFIAGKTIKEWIRQGGKDEDNPLLDFRYTEHFHDPLKTWDQAGLDIPLIWHWGSSLYWAQMSTSATVIKKNLYSWPWAREKYYQVLISGDEKTFADTFSMLGRLTHLVSDLAVPAHVRNDSHPFKNYVPPSWKTDPYEIWTANEDNLKAEYFVVNPDSAESVNSVIFNNAIPNSLAPVAISALWDQDKYTEALDNPGITLSETVGLAEYTNANFFSKDTIYTYPYPSKGNTFTKNDAAIDTIKFSNIQLDDIETIIDEKGISGKRLYAYAKDGDGEKYKIASLGYYSDELSYLDGPDQWADHVLDDPTHADYAARLIPRAVGYSTALIDYFFRGTIEIAQPLQGGYAFVEDPTQGFTQITVLARNTSPEGEDMTNGSIELVIKYRISQGDPFQNVPADSWPEIYYTVVSESNNINSIPRDNPVELVFDLPEQEAIPINATDVYLQLVYKGTLGNEEGAVAVGFKDISEPTPVDFFNNMDKICINGTWYDAGSLDAIDIVDGNNNGIADPEYDLHEWDVYNHGLRDIYIGFSPVSYPLQPTSLNYDAFIPELLTGENKRVFVLADYDFSIGASADTIITLDHNDSWVHPPIAKADSFGGVKNQEENGVRQYPLYESFRGLLVQDVIIYQNPPYPSGSVCDDSLLNKD